MPEKNSNPFTKMLVGILELGFFGYAIVSSFVKGWGNPRYGVLLLHLVVVVALAALFRRSSARREKILWTVLLLAESLLLAPFFGPLFAQDAVMPAWFWLVSCWCLSLLGFLSILRTVFSHKRPGRPPESA